MSERKAKISNPETVREANRYFMTKVLFNAFLIFFGAILIGTFLTQMQAKTASKHVSFFLISSPRLLL